MRRSILSTLIMLVLPVIAALPSTGALAQEQYPNRPITLLPEVDAIFGRPPTFSRDQFAGIARLNADPVIVVVNAEAPWKNLKDLIDDAKRRPGEITFSSSGPYGASHVPTEMLLQAAGGLRMRHLPTTGGGPAMTAGARRARTVLVLAARRRGATPEIRQGPRLRQHRRRAPSL